MSQEFRNGFNFIAIVLMICWVQLIESEDFCLALRRNGDRISYTFTRSSKDNQKPKAIIYIIIHGNYWKIEFDNHEDNPHRLKFLDEKQSLYSVLFSNQYSFGLEININETLLYLINNKNWNVMTGEIPNDDKILFKELSDYRPKNRMTLKGVSENYLFGFQLNFEDDNQTVAFVYQKGNQLKANGFRLETNSEELIATPKTVYNLRNMTKLTIDSPVLTVLQQYSHFRDTFGYIILTIRKGVVMWCWTSYQFTDNKCISQIQSLIDCSDVFVGRAVPQTHWLVLSVVGFLVIWIAIIISIFLFMRIRDNNREDGRPKRVSVVKPSKIKQINQNKKVSLK